MAKNLSRRHFLKTAGAAAAAIPFLYPRMTRADEAKKLRVASIGVGGMGWNDIRTIHGSGKANIVAICDVDKNNIATAAKMFPDAHVYSDFRELFKKEGSEIDAVQVSTPDHMHAPIAMTAINLGKHVYCQKPMAHEIYECRQLAKAAAAKKVVTQMGIQIHSHIAYRMAAQMIQEGVIGKVSEVHSWSNKVWAGPKEGRPDRKDPVPANLDWELWLGVAPERPFVEKIYHQANWRGWVDFGTGTQGDMACHIVDPVYTSLKLTGPTLVWAEGPSPNPETWAQLGTAHYEFPGTPFTTDTLKYTWYNGARKPDLALAPGEKKLPDQGSVFVGDKGTMLLEHVGGPRLLPKENFVGVKKPELKNIDHYHQWVEACLGQGETTTPFSYSGPLTEGVLLGLVASYFPTEKLKWDSEKLVFPEHEKATAHLRRTYRKGWEIEGLS